MSGGGGGGGTTRHKIVYVESDFFRYFSFISDQVTGGQTTIFVTVGGYCKFQGNKPQTFSQNFMLTSQNNTWKIVSDCIRTVE